MWVSVEVDAGDLVEPVGDHGGDVVVVAHPDQRDQVDLAGHGVDLADALERGDRLGHLGDAGDVGLDEHDGGDHVGNLSDLDAWARPTLLNFSGARNEGRDAEGHPGQHHEQAEDQLRWVHPRGVEGRRGSRELVACDPYDADHLRGHEDQDRGYGDPFVVSSASAASSARPPSRRTPTTKGQQVAVLMSTGRNSVITVETMMLTRVVGAACDDDPQAGLLRPRPGRRS